MSWTEMNEHNTFKLDSECFEFIHVWLLEFCASADTRFMWQLLSPLL